jgi:hypothetical protein
MELPNLKEVNQVTFETLIQCFFKQVMAFSEFMNEAPDRIETEKYADFVLWVLRKDLHRIMDEKNIPHKEYSL